MDDALEAEAERKIYEAVLNEISLPVIGRYIHIVGAYEFLVYIR